MSLGPIEIIVIGFPENRFTGEIVPALTDLVEAGFVRIVDLVFVTKDDDGTVSALELNELDDIRLRRVHHARRRSSTASSARRTSRTSASSSSRARRSRCSSSSTCGRRASRTRWPTPAACSSTRSASPAT